MQHAQDRFQWDDLRYVLAVARARSVSGAAQQLRVDHTTVSRRVTRLEQLLNTALFDRTRSGYSTTAAGAKVVELARQMESALIRCEGEITNRNDELRGTVRVATPDGFGSIFLAPRLAQLCTEHPELRVQLYPSQLRYSLADREVDIAIGLQKPAAGRLTARKLTEYRIRLYAAHSFCDRNDLPHSFEALNEVPVIGYVENLGTDPPVDFLPLLPGKVRARFTSSNLLAQINAVQAGQGIGFLPDFVVDGRPEFVRVPVEFHVDRELWLMIHEDNRNLARVQAVAEFIQSEVRKSRSAFFAD